MVAHGNKVAGTLLRDVARLHVRAQRHQAACCEMTVAQCHVITELGRVGALPVTELGRRLALDKGWISRTVTGLAEEGLVLRRGRASDGRVVVLSLSPAGRRRFKALNDALDRQATRVLERIAPSRRRGVRLALEWLRAALRSELELDLGEGASRPEDCR